MIANETNYPTEFKFKWAFVAKGSYLPKFDNVWFMN